MLLIEWIFSEHTDSQIGFLCDRNLSALTALNGPNSNTEKRGRVSLCPDHLAKSDVAKLVSGDHHLKAIRRIDAFLNPQLSAWRVGEAHLQEVGLLQLLEFGTDRDKSARVSSVYGLRLSWRSGHPRVHSCPVFCVADDAFNRNGCFKPPVGLSLQERTALLLRGLLEDPGSLSGLRHQNTIVLAPLQLTRSPAVQGDRSH